MPEPRVWIGKYCCNDTLVEAGQWPSGDSYDEVCARAAIHRWVWGHDGHTWVTTPKNAPEDVFVVLETLQGNVRVNAGDWIVRGSLNTFFRFDAETFARDFKEAAHA